MRYPASFRDGAVVIAELVCVQSRGTVCLCDMLDIVVLYRRSYVDLLHLSLLLCKHDWRVFG